MSFQVRVDKWLWAVRVYKTRSIAAEACKKGHVVVRDRVVKPSFLINEGDVVQVKKSPVVYSFKVLKCAESRMAAKFVPEFMENVTPAEQYELLEMNRISGFIDRARGSGRPTKKERRDMDNFIEDFGCFDDFEFEE